MNTYFAYNTRQWESTFNDKFLIKTCSSTNEKYYHYTSLSNALKILELHKEDDSTLTSNKNPYISLYASHFLFLNDGEELLNGLNLSLEGLMGKSNIISTDNDEVKKWKERLKTNIENLKNISPNQMIDAPNHFIVCFCRDGNLLTQWEYYGKESGIAIELDLDNCCYDGLTVQHTNKPNIPLVIEPRKIIYDNDEKANILKQGINNFIVHDVHYADILTMQSVAAASFMKHKAFASEKEVRLLFSPIMFPGYGEDSIQKLIKFRDANGLAKPYMEIHVKHKESNKIPVKSIVVGPGHNQQLVFNAMIEFIRTKYVPLFTPVKKIGYNEKEDLYSVEIGNITVCRSTIPFRG